MKFSKNVLMLCLLLLGLQTARAEWTKQNAGTLAWLYDVYFLDERKGWIAGSDGTLLKTEDGGETWAQKRKFTEDSIKQIYFADERKGWLLCERDIYSRGANRSSYLLRTIDGGASWERVEISGGGRERIAKILFGANGALLAFGEGGIFLTLDPAEKDWKKLPAPARYLLLDGEFVGGSNGVIVGAGGTILFTEDAGASWNKANVFGANEAGKLSSVFFVNQKAGWTVGAGGKIFQAVSGGRTWREQQSPTAKNLKDVFFINTAEGWAVGDEGTIIHTKTAGNVWTLEDSNARHNLEKVFFVGRKGWAVGFGGTILSFNEGGDVGKPALLKAF